MATISAHEVRRPVKTDECFSLPVASDSTKDGSSSEISTTTQEKKSEKQHSCCLNTTAYDLLHATTGKLQNSSTTHDYYSSQINLTKAESSASVSYLDNYTSGDGDSVSNIINGLMTDKRKCGSTFNFTEKAKSSSSKSQLGSSTVSSLTELEEIQQSVRRLRAQRTHVECLGQRNEDLERLLTDQKAEIEILQREVFTLRGSDVTYLQSMELLERRARGLEEACSAKTMELRSATEKLACVEQECDQLRQDIHHTQQEHEEELATLKHKLKKLTHHIEKHEHSHGAQSDDQQRLEHHWKQNMTDAARANSQTVDSIQQQLEQCCKENSKLKTEVRELEQQVQKLLATTVRQTTVIEECDRVISETTAQYQQAQRSYEEQLQLSYELSTSKQRLEAQVALLKLSKGSEVADMEKSMILLQTKLAQCKDQLQVTGEAQRGKVKEIEVMQRAYVTRDQNRLQIVEVKSNFPLPNFSPRGLTPSCNAKQANKKLQQNEKKLKSDLSELQIALRDASHEKTLLSEQVLDLQEQLETERKDRSRWATSRLKLLAEFCDEESKFGVALTHYDASFDDQRCSLSEKLKASPQARRKARCRQVVKNKALDEQSYDGDDSDREDMPRRSSIVFG